MLYAKGVFINKSFGALNLSAPELVRQVHEAYVRAGADVIETNTFGANRLKLASFGIADKLHTINVEGARLARRAARDRAYVAGSIGPLGVRIEPWGKTGTDQARDCFEEQAKALAEGGVDLFILETFRDLNEIGAAIDAVRRVSDLPIVAQMTIEDDGNSLDGTPPEQFAPALEEAGADVIGLNCSIGPAHMLEALERMAASARARLCAQPNAGRPRDVEGRTIYLTSPEYMASYARRFAERGVRLVGGCCGTTPEHTAQMKNALVRPAAPAAPRPAAGTSRAGRNLPSRAGPMEPSHPAATAAAMTVPRAEKSPLSRALAQGRWITLLELEPPRGHDTGSVLEEVRRLRALGVDAVHVPDVSAGPRLSALAMAVLVRQQAGIDVVLQYSSREKPLLTMQSELLGAHALGVRNVLAVTGDVRAAGDYTDASAVVDVDSIGLVNAVSRLNQGQDIGGQNIGTPTSFHLGVTVNPGAEDLESEIRRFTHKVEAGAEFVIARPVFDVGAFEPLQRALEASRLPIVLSVRPLASALDAEYLANEVPGVRMPLEIAQRLRRAADEDAAAEQGVAIASELGRALAPQVSGINVVPPPGRLDLGLAVLQRLRDEG